MCVLHAMYGDIKKDFEESPDIDAEQHQHGDETKDDLTFRGIVV